MPDATFALHGELLGEAIQLTAAADEDPDVLQALASDQPFPDRPIELGRVRLASAAQQIRFDTDAGPVVFGGGAGGGVAAGLGVYTDPQQLLGTLAPDEQIAPALDLGVDAEARYVLLRLGYDLSASGQGTLPLGAPGAFSFGAEGKTTGLFALIRRFERAQGARTVVTEAVQAVRMPRQVDASEDLAPGTWLVIEVEGEVGVKLGATLGFTFNWIREATAGTLRGDVGLRLQLGLAATLGLSAAGRYLVALGRPGADETLRLRLFKLNKKGLGFALDLDATVQGQADGLPEHPGDLVAAVLGVHGQQILKDLEDLRRWTDPAQDLPDMLGGAGVDYAKELLEELTGLDPEAAFDEARGAVLDLLDAWNALPARVAAQVTDLVRKTAAQQGANDELEALRRFMQTLVSGTNSEIRQQIEGVLEEVAFFQTPAGQWLEAVAAQGVLVLIDRAALVRDVAEKTLAVLDGETVEKVLLRLHEYLDERLSIGRIEEVVSQATFKELDAWLKVRLSAFLGEQVDLVGVEKIRTTIRLLLQKAPAFYQMALAALRRQHAFDAAFAFQRTDTGTALIDVSFSGSQASLQRLREALRGDFGGLLTQKHPGVTLHAAALTHATERRRHVEVHFPFFDVDVDHVNQALARVDAVDQEGARVLVYDLDARDAVTRAHRRNSVLALGAHLPVSMNNQTRVFDADAFTYSYAFDQAVPAMHTSDLRYQIKPYGDLYFPSVFSPINTDAVRASFDTWVADLDKTIDRLEPRLATTDLFGNTLLALRLSLPGKVAGAWLKASRDRKDAAYMEMSRRLQRQLKRLIPFYHFQDVEHYGNLVPAGALLVYAAIPPSTSVRLSSSRLRAFNTDKDVFWNWPDPKEREAVVFAPHTQALLGAALQRVHDRLTAAGRAGTARFYRPERVGEFLRGVIDAHGQTFLHSLLFVEATLIEEARKAGLALAAFVAAADTDPAEAVTALTRFGREVTEVFNERVVSIFGGEAGEALRPLGTLLFVEAARAFDPGLTGVQPRALLDLAVFKPDAPFPPAGFPNHAPPMRDQVVIQQRIIALSEA